MTRNCVSCGQPDYVHAEDFPELECSSCGNAIVVDKDYLGNYIGVCRKCRKEWKLADLVPSWEEVGFPEHPIAAWPFF